MSVGGRGLAEVQQGRLAAEGVSDEELVRPASCRRSAPRSTYSTGYPATSVGVGETLVDPGHYGVHLLDGPHPPGDRVLQSDRRLAGCVQLSHGLVDVGAGLVHRHPGGVQLALHLAQLLHAGQAGQQIAVLVAAAATRPRRSSR